MKIANHRFLSHAGVTQEEMESSMAMKTRENCNAMDHILVIQDTSEISFPRQKIKKQSFGPTASADIPGFFIHPNLVLNPKNGEILGLAGVCA